MKGLLLKDYFTLLKQLRFYLVFLLIFTIIPNMNLSSIAIVYAAMLPITVIAYDERSKWDQLAAMMPYTKRDLVFSKYLLGYIGVAIFSFITLALQAGIGLIGKSGFTTEQALTILITAAAGLILLAINLPFMFWLGVERGRVVFMVLIGVTVFLGMMSAESAKELLAKETISTAQLLLLCGAATIATNVVSIYLSSKIYRKKKI
ncbi:MAG: ABC-2 transporter permease [Christensenella sp.]|nr:ABC-2 transporter permease [Christensenella sp.]